MLCEQFPHKSDERYILRNFAHVFLPLLYVYGNRKSNIDKAKKAFLAGKWEKLWDRARSNAAIKKERLAIRPRNNAPRSVEQKIKYAITLAQKGNLTKSNSVITKELIPAIDDTTVVKLADKHPERPLTFNDLHWPDDEDAKDFWGRQEGVDAMRSNFSTSNIGVSGSGRDVHAALPTLTDGARNTFSSCS